MKTALITGGAGFIGSHLVDHLLQQQWRVIAVDNFDPFYNPSWKRRNVACHLGNAAYTLVEADIRDTAALEAAIGKGCDVVVHLAAKAGVLPSLQDPVLYSDVNITGTHNLLQLARKRGIDQFVFASSSSVYGTSPDVPWREDHTGLQPISPYAATKLSSELMGHCYSHLFGIRFLALRFFTAYGPRQRPDLAIHKFARLIGEGKPIRLYGDGQTRRDYTYVEDLVSGIVAAMTYDRTPFEVINLGSGRPKRLQELISTLEAVMGTRANVVWEPLPPGDVPQTVADVSKARRLLGYDPATEFAAGLDSFYRWFRTTEHAVRAASI